MLERRTHDYVLNGITSLFAAFNIADGAVIGELHRQHRATQFRTFLATIDKTVPAQLDIHVRSGIIRILLKEGSGIKPAAVQSRRWGRPCGCWAWWRPTRRCRSWHGR